MHGHLNGDFINEINAKLEILNSGSATGVKCGSALTLYNNFTISSHTQSCNQSY